MKKGNTAAIVLIIMALLIGCLYVWSIRSTTPYGEHVKQIEEGKQKEVLLQQQVEQIQNEANKIIGGLRYYKDTRINICFAYMWRGDYRGGPALSEVPCEKIPESLLTVAIVK